jgi:hypothetical protein
MSDDRSMEAAEAPHEAAQRLCIIAQDILRRFDAGGALVSPIGLPNSVEAIRSILDRLDDVPRSAEATQVPASSDNLRRLDDALTEMGIYLRREQLAALVDRFPGLRRESPQATSQTILNTLKDGER